MNERDLQWELGESIDRDLGRNWAHQLPVAQQLRLHSMSVGFRPAVPDTTAPDGRCYADARAIGARDRRPEGGKVEQACARHAEWRGRK